MKLSFTPAQVETGKRLIKWLVKDHKYELDQARLYTAQLLIRYPHAKIKAAMAHSGCTSPKKLKEILLGKEFKSELY